MSGAMELGGGAGRAAGAAEDGCSATSVGFDALIYAWPPGGIATYQTRLMDALRAVEGVSVAFSGGFTGDPTFAEVAGLTRSPVRQRHALFALNLARSAGLKSHIHHLTAFWRPPALRAKRLVLTVHDMIPERLGDAYPGVRHTHYDKASLASAADAIICPAESVREDVIELLGLPEDRVFTVPHGRPPLIQPEAGTPFEAESGGYVLKVGRRSHYKNFLDVLPNLAPVLRRTGLSLVCAGGGPFTVEERAALTALGIAGSTAQMALSPGELAAAYANAFCVVAPSKAEGFGLPLLEAMTYGAPVIAADIAVKRETAADAVLWCDPEEPEAWGAALQRLADDPALRARLSSAGPQRAASFSWERAAQATAEIYRAVA